MLDILELLGVNFDDSDGGRSVQLHRRLFPSSEPRSICAEMVRRKWWVAVLLIGPFHCLRSSRRYD